MRIRQNLLALLVGASFGTAFAQSQAQAPVEPKVLVAPQAPIAPTGMAVIPSINADVVEKSESMPIIESKKVYYPMRQ